jgi:5-formyltetrahydrofolate cyclo-ligase
VTISAKKQDLRKIVRQNRQIISPTERQNSALKVARLLSALSGEWPEGIIAGYCAQGSELDIFPALQHFEKTGCQIALPVINGQTLIFRRYRIGDPLYQSAFKTKEPEAHKPQCQPAVVLIPLLAFDGDLMRLGQGAGFYDRALADLQRKGPVLKIGIAFDCQKVEQIPTEPHDQRLDLVVTEKAVYRFQIGH